MSQDSFDVAESAYFPPHTRIDILMYTSIFIRTRPAFSKRIPSSGTSGLIVFTALYSRIIAAVAAASLSSRDVLAAVDAVEYTSCSSKYGFVDMSTANHLVGTP